MTTDDTLTNLSKRVTERNSVLDKLIVLMSDAIIHINDSDLDSTTKEVLSVMFRTHKNHFDDRKTQLEICEMLVKTICSMGDRIVSLGSRIVDLETQLATLTERVPA